MRVVGQRSVTVKGELAWRATGEWVAAVSELLER